MNNYLIAAVLAVLPCVPARALECPADNVAVTGKRPPVAERLFRSEAVERQVNKVKSLLKNAKLAAMFENCFPNTLDTTVFFTPEAEDGKPDTFVDYRRHSCNVAERLCRSGMAVSAICQ